MSQFPQAGAAAPAPQPGGGAMSADGTQAQPQPQVNMMMGGRTGGNRMGGLAKGIMPTPNPMKQMKPNITMATTSPVSALAQQAHANNAQAAAPGLPASPQTQGAGVLQAPQQAPVSPMAPKMASANAARATGLGWNKGATCTGAYQAFNAYATGKTGQSRPTAADNRALSTKRATDDNQTIQTIQNRATGDGLSERFRSWTRPWDAIVSAVKLAAGPVAPADPSMGPMSTALSAPPQPQPGQPAAGPAGPPAPPAGAPPAGDPSQMMPQAPVPAPGGQAPLPPPQIPGQPQAVDPQAAQMIPSLLADQQQVDPAGEDMNYQKLVMGFDKLGMTATNLKNRFEKTAEAKDPWYFRLADAAPGLAGAVGGPGARFGMSGFKAKIQRYDEEDKKHKRGRYAEKTAWQTNTPTGHDRTSASGDGNNMGYAHKDDDYDRGPKAWENVTKYLKHGAPAQDSRMPSSATTKMAGIFYRDLEQPKPVQMPASDGGYYEGSTEQIAEPRTLTRLFADSGAGASKRLQRITDEHTMKGQPEAVRRVVAMRALLQTHPQMFRQRPDSSAFGLAQHAKTTDTLPGQRAYTKAWKASKTDQDRADIDNRISQEGAAAYAAHHGLETLHSSSIDDNAAPYHDEHPYWIAKTAAFDLSSFGKTIGENPLAAAGVGAAVGGGLGYLTSDDEHKGRNALLGAAAGGGVGYGGAQVASQGMSPLLQKLHGMLNTKAAAFGKPTKAGNKLAKMMLRNPAAEATPAKNMEPRRKSKAKPARRQKRGADAQGLKALAKLIIKKRQEQSQGHRGQPQPKHHRHELPPSPPHHAPVGQDKGHNGNFSPDNVKHEDGHDQDSSNSFSGAKTFHRKTASAVVESFHYALASDLKQPWAVAAALNRLLKTASAVDVAKRIGLYGGAGGGAKPPVQGTGQVMNAASQGAGQPPIQPTAAPAVPAVKAGSFTMALAKLAAGVDPDEVSGFESQLQANPDASPAFTRRQRPTPYHRHAKQGSEAGSGVMDVSGRPATPPPATQPIVRPTTRPTKPPTDLPGRSSEAFMTSGAAIKG